MRKPFPILTACVILVLLLALGYVGLTRFLPPHPVAVGTPIRHDDFLFTVTRVQRRVLPRGNVDYLVSVRIESQAKVVGYRWHDSIAYVRAFDGRGFGHDFFPLSSNSFTLAPGESRTVQLEFQIPAGMSSANVRFWDGIFMGDALNGAAYAKAIVPLEPYHPPFGT